MPSEKDNPVSIRYGTKAYTVEGKNAIIGVSLDSSSDYGRDDSKIAELLACVKSQKFSQCGILLADGNLRLLSLKAQSADPEASQSVLLDRSKIEGEVWLKKHNVSSHLSDSLYVVHWHEVESIESFGAVQQSISHLYRDSEKFKGAVDDMATTYYDRLRGRKGAEVLNEAALDFCKQYVLLELSGLAALADQKQIHYFLYPQKQPQAMFQMKSNWFKHYGGGKCAEYLHWGIIQGLVESNAKPKLLSGNSVSQFFSSKRPGSKNVLDPALLEESGELMRSISTLVDMKVQDRIKQFEQKCLVMGGCCVFLLFLSAYFALNLSRARMDLNNTFGYSA